MFPNFPFTRLNLYPRLIQLIRTPTICGANCHAILYVTRHPPYCGLDACTHDGIRGIRSNPSKSLQALNLPLQHFDASILCSRRFKKKHFTCFGTDHFLSTSDTQEKCSDSNITLTFEPICLKLEMAFP